MKNIPLGQVCSKKKCTWFELGYSVQCFKEDHTYKPNGDLENKS